MKIKILGSTQKDLQKSYQFYEVQQKGIGTYFLGTLSTDIESLKLYADIHPLFLTDTIDCSPKGSLLLSITEWRAKTY